MKKREQCIQELSDIYLLLYEAIINYDYCYYLNSPRTDSELSYIEKTGHFKVMRLALFKAFVTDVAKLLIDSDSHHFNVHKLFRKLEPGGEFDSLMVPSEDIRKYKGMMDWHEETISKVCLLRNKRYSHRDRLNHTMKDLDVTFQDLDELIEALKSILNGLGHHVHQTMYDFQNIYFDRERFRIIQILAEQDKRIP